MRLIPAPGSSEMQLASSRPYIRKIVEILLLIIDVDQIAFKAVALLLKNNVQRTSPGFSEKLHALRTYGQRRPDARGRFIISPYIDELVEALMIMYGQHQKQLNYERGAIVELLASELVCSRCNSGECKNNYRFIDGRYTSDQIDIAVLATSRQQIEGYACKIKPIGFMSEDCTNLTALASKAHELDYEVHIGVICFDNSRVIFQRVEDKLSDIVSTTAIYAYGLDNIQELKINPFRIESLER